MAPRTDPLTGLLTRRDFDDRIRDEVASSAADGRDLSLVFVDIDNFKTVNDTHGRDIGDSVISALGDLVRSSAPDESLSARFGGEEFALILPDTEREQAFLAAERIRVAMDSESAFCAGERELRLRITVSAGVAAYPTDGTSVAELLRKADQALYRAKSTGRNKVCIAQEERMTTKTTHYTVTQLHRLSHLAKDLGLGEADLLREALDDLLMKYRVSQVRA